MGKNKDKKKDGVTQEAKVLYEEPAGYDYTGARNIVSVIRQKLDEGPEAANALVTNPNIPLMLEACMLECLVNISLDLEKMSRNIR